MKHLLEYLSTNITGDTEKIRQGKIVDAPSSWEVGDILKGYYTYSGVIPYFYKIIKKNNNTFTLVRLKKNIVSGYLNGVYKVMPGEDEDEKPIVKRPNKYGRIEIGSGWAAVTLTLWDGKTPLEGDGRN